LGAVEFNIVEVLDGGAKRPLETTIDHHAAEITGVL